MKNVLLFLVLISFGFISSTNAALPQKEAETFLKHIKPVCGGENRCYYRAKEGTEVDEDLGSALYFACKEGYASFSRIDKGHDKFLRCLSSGVKALIKHFIEMDDTETADYLRPWISDCESRSSVTSRFKCYQAYLRDGEGKYN